MLHEVIRFTVNFQPNNNNQSGSAYNVVGNGYNTVFGNGVLLPIGTVLCKNYSICTLYDSGADLSLITHRLAQHLGLYGRDIDLSITKVGNTVELCQSKCYKLTLLDL